MKVTLEGAQIREIVSVIPATEIDFLSEAEQYNLSRSKALKIKQTFGFDKRRVAHHSECASDLAFYGISHLLKDGIDRKEIGALIYITQTPDNLMPATSYHLHGRLQLDPEVVCLDLNQGCNGFIYGLLLAYQMIRSLNGKVALLINADTLSHRTSDLDYKINPMIGDAAAITVVEPCSDGEAHFSIRSDGSRSGWLQIPAGGFRMPATDKTGSMVTFSDGTSRSLNHFTMNGPGVFTFTQTDVVELISDLIVTHGVNIDEFDRFFFHQPNRFLLQKLANALNIPTEKIPNNTINWFGNQSGASIPHTICHSTGKEITQQRLFSCISGFGVGLSWGAVITNIGPLRRAEIIEKPHPK